MHHVTDFSYKSRDVSRDRLPNWERPLSETPEHELLEDTVT